MDSLLRKKILIAGLGKSGKAVAIYLLNKGATVSFFDDQPLLEKDPEVLQISLKGLRKVSLDEVVNSAFDFLIVSPGFPRKHPVYEISLKKNIPILGEMELAFQVSKGKKMVGVTGTNGKTTVVTEIKEALLTKNAKVEVLGNIGTPLIEKVNTPEIDLFVLEISSFQLETLSTPKLISGCILNITPDHLDRYDSMEEYALTKGLISRTIVSHGRLYVEEKTLKTWRSWIDHPGIASFGFTQLCDIAIQNGGIFRFGKKEGEVPPFLSNKPVHEVGNFLAAFALLRDLHMEPVEIFKALHHFKKPPHRIESVAKINGISFFDDSKGTNIDAVLKAVDSMKGQVILIVGGVDKGASYRVWIPHFLGKVAQIIAMGQSKEKIKKELHPEFAVVLSENLEEAVKTAFQLANGGDNILLSPGCSSFDMFRDYKHRGEEFKKIVSTLEGVNS